MEIQATVNFSVIVVCRNRDIEAVERHLRSLDHQSYDSFEVLFMDYGSDETISFAYERIVNSLKRTRYYFNDTRDRAWNKAHAINSAARMALGRFIVTIDVDLIVAKHVLAQLAHLARAERAISAHFLKLPKGFSRWSELEQSKTWRLPRSEKNASGALQVIPREVFLSLRGLDEYYSFWGVEDVDFTRRLAAYGIKIAWVDTGAVFHQWHPPVHGLVMPRGWWIAMNLHFGMRSDKLIRNPATWGILVQPSSRIPVDHVPASEQRNFVMPRLMKPFRPFPRVSLPALGAFELAYFSRRIAIEFTNASPGEIFVCRIAHCPTMRIGGFIYKLLFFAQCRPVDGRRFFSPIYDVPDVLWHFVLGRYCCDDYRYIRAPSESMFIFRKSTTNTELT